MKIKTLSDEQLMVEMGIWYDKTQKAFRVDDREYNKARAKLRRLRNEYKARQDKQANGKENQSVE